MNLWINGKDIIKQPHHSSTLDNIQHKSLGVRSWAYKVYHWHPFMTKWAEVKLIFKKM
jgi:hypothetical protein